MPTYSLHLADNALILGHRNSEWTGHGPILEQDIALSNIALDLVGHARNFYQYAATLIDPVKSTFATFRNIGTTITEDHLAYLRDAGEYRNVQLVEQPNGDWAHTILRQFFFSTYQYYLYTDLLKSGDRQLAAIAEKSIKETTYHLRWSSEWVIRLGDGTTESHERMLVAISNLEPFTPELFNPAPFEKQAAAAGFGVDPAALKERWMDKVETIFNEATLQLTKDNFFVTNGKEGFHSEHLSYLLSEMQFLQRTHPGATW
ncbi:1,2-phenylacetyl-CoA epoxidase subunit PaaC [Segetibacter sp. 3557_3]|uniref:1,2-phenylacetyl-CoA epoxidase subunit PaaC n=1 Tax=Segetibacter sp. 3557_3 TaxID=2547429 RepID=UPI001A9DB06D|nr:1,2-phenylacetyl-CoA epoxidase subunit PaaC [Segetibacter sp. 3557_3]